MAYSLDGLTIETDEAGYLSDSSQWNREVAVLIARNERIELQDDHWQVVNYLRCFYQEHRRAPTVRVLTQAMRKTLGAEKGNSRYLYQLFPRGTTTQASKIAGLPKPMGCI
jgi:TusE/DsrC/DsvC family sulfur relay protein